MEQKPYHLMTDEELDVEIDEAMEAAQSAPSLPMIVSATFYTSPGEGFLELKLNDGRRLLVPREELGELKNATAEQAKDLVIGPNGVDIWWPQIDDGLYLPDFLQYRWRNDAREVAA